MEKVQVKVYLSPKVAEALRIAAAKRGGQGAMSAVAEEILRKALGVEEDEEMQRHDAMTYAEAIRRLADEGYDNVDYGDGWTDILDHLNSLEDAAYETQVVIQDRDGVLAIVPLDERGYLKSEPLAWVKR